MPFRKHERIEDKTPESIPTPGDASDGNESDLETGHRISGDGYRHQQPSEKWTGHQLFYIFGLHGIGAGILSGGINFAIAYGMYTTQNLQTNPIRLFQLPNTLAGDAVVTIFIQTLMTWFIELIVVHRDLRKNGVRPIGFATEPSRPLMRWLMLLDLHGGDGTRDAARSKRWAPFLVDQLVRVGLVSAVAFFVLWLPSVGILTAIGQRRPGDWDWYYQSKWVPEAFKAVFGGVLALLTTPLMASFWVVREGWRLKRGGALLSS